MQLRIRRKLREPQERALNYALSVDHPALLLDKRVGKTLTTIRYAKKLGLRTCIVVCPTSVIETWERELREEREVSIRGYGLTAKKRLEAIYELDNCKYRKWIIVNKEAILADAPSYVYKHGDKERKKRRVPLIGQIAWDLVVVDESVFLANAQAQIHDVFCKGFRTVRHRAILSGNVAPESLLQVFGQFKFLRGEFMGHTSFWEWRDKWFEQPLWDPYAWRPKKGAEELIKKAVHNNACVITREDAGMSVKKTYEVRYVGMNAKQKRMYKEVEEAFATEEYSTNLATTQYLWLARIAGGCDPDGNLISEEKLKELVSLLKGDLASEKVVVWCRFKAELDAIKKALIRAGIDYVIVYGGMAAGDRANKIRLFRDIPNIRVFLATEASAKFGIDVSVARACIYYSNDYSSEARDQSEDRIVNVDSKVSPLIIDLVTRNTVDEIALKVVKDKNINARMFMTRFDEIYKEMRRERSKS